MRETVSSVKSISSDKLFRLTGHRKALALLLNDSMRRHRFELDQDPPFGLLENVISNATLSACRSSQPSPQVHAGLSAVSGVHRDLSASIQQEVLRWKRLFNSFAFPKHFYMAQLLNWA